MKVLLAPDSFKGSLSASEFCEIAARAMRTVDPGIEVISMPMSDGGEGLAEILLAAQGGRHCRAFATDPMGRRVEAGYTILADQTTAVIDFASASGLTRVEPEYRNPLTATSLGTGQLMLSALEAGCIRLLLGLGGSASNDGGTGALSALGFQFQDRDGQLLPAGGAALERLHHVDSSQVSPLLLESRIELICDVTAPLLGADGASRVFSPQKGADSDAVEQLEAGLAHLAKVLGAQIESSESLAAKPGSGAAGGAGFGMAGLLNARIQNGFESVASTLGLEERLSSTAPDLVMTGEGCIDGQTLQGKVVQGVAAACARAGVCCVALAGQVKPDAEPLLSMGLSRMVALASEDVSRAQAIQRAEALLEKAVGKLILEFSGSTGRFDTTDPKKA